MLIIECSSCKLGSSPARHEQLKIFYFSSVFHIKLSGLFPVTINLEQ
jgi:hypothetical protein